MLLHLLSVALHFIFSGGLSWGSKESTQGPQTWGACANKQPEAARASPGLSL